jgi:tRNA(Ile)-lysidine synthase
VDSDLSQPFSSFDFATRVAVIAAVSGGSDSTALLLLLKAYLDANAPAVRLVAVTVDHGLRPDSAAEALAVARFAESRGIAHRTLSWEGPKPATGLPAAAREARYALLAEAAGEEGTDLIVTGHTADDQAETVAMRQARSDGRGLAGMAPATLFDGKAWIVRPLLETRREMLRDYLRANGVAWLEDPTNVNQAFERPRARARLRDEADVSKLLAAARDAALLREYLGREAAGLIWAHARHVAPGLFRLGPAFAEAEPRDGAVYALRMLLAAIGGTPHLPDEARAARLFDRFSAKPFCATLSRTLVDARRGGVFLLRETRGLPEPEPVRDGMIWDGRYRISGQAADFLVGPASHREEAEPAAVDDVPPSLVRAALSAEPMFWRRNAQTLTASTAPHPLPVKDGERESPTLTPPSLRPSRGEGKGEGQSSSFRRAKPPREPATPIATPLVAPWVRFLPSFDLEPARAVAELLGAAPPPASPYANHNVTGA